MNVNPIREELSVAISEWTKHSEAGIKKLVVIALIILSENFVLDNSIPFLENMEDSVAEALEALNDNGEISSTGEVLQAPKKKRYKNMDDQGIDYLSKECEPYFPKGEVRKIMKRRWYSPAENGVFKFNEGEKFDTKKQ